MQPPCCLAPLSRAIHTWEVEATESCATLPPASDSGTAPRRSTSRCLRPRAVLPVLCCCFCAWSNLFLLFLFLISFATNPGGRGGRRTEQWRSPPRLGSAPRPRRANAAGGAGKRQRCGGAAGAEGAAHKRARSLCPWVRCIVLPLGSGCILVACSHYPYYLDNSSIYPYISIWPLYPFTLQTMHTHTHMHACMHAHTHTHTVS